ncbi:MAG: YceI family protein [Thiohalomonadales bacterium]
MKNKMMKNIIGVIAITIASSTITVSAEVATAGAYKIDSAHSTVLFTVSHLGTSNLTGRFNTVAGDMNFTAKGKSSVEITIQTNSIDTNHQKRDAHLRSPDFFNAKQYPVIKFVSNKVNYNAKGEPTSINGKLSMHGKTKAVTLNVSSVGAGKDPWGGYRAGYDATTTIKRSEFGMNFMPGGIGDDIKITLNIEATKI